MNEVRRASSTGVDGRRRPRPHKRLLSLAQQQELATLLAQEAPGGGPWTGPKIAAVMGEWLGRPVAPVVAWGYFFHLGFRAHAVKVAEQAAKPAADAVRRQRPDTERGPQYQGRKAYPTDLNDAEWEAVAPLVERPRGGRGRPPRWPRREILNAIFYLDRSGCAWVLLPHDFPPYKTVYHWFNTWRQDGTWSRVNDALRQKERQRAGRDPEPSAGLLDSQSVKTGERGGSADLTGARRSRVASATS